mgnify:CR=1 FL=1
MENPEKTKSIIAEDVEITGSIKSSTPLHIEGKLNGDLTCTNSVTVGQSSSIRGNLSVDSVVVMGQITGNITAKDKIELKATARLTGDIKARRLSVEDGVTFIGKSEVNPSGSVPRTETKSVHEIAPEHENIPADDDDKNKGSRFFGKK